jgi:hypothetical protein
MSAISKEILSPLAVVTVSVYFFGSPPVGVDDVMVLALTSMLVLTGCKKVLAEHKVHVIIVNIVAKMQKLLTHFIASVLEYTKACCFLVYKDQPVLSGWEEHDLTVPERDSGQ